jgi:excisionase family DNA binding protein
MNLWHEWPMMLTTHEAARRLGVTHPHIIHLIHQGRLPAKRFGWMWMIDSDDVKNFKRLPPGPRPKKKS